MQVFVVGSVVVACSVKVTRLPLAGESLSGSAFLAEPGGKGFNLALALSRLGIGVDGIFSVGEDMFSSLISSTFAQVGYTSEMLVHREGSTGAGVAFVDPAGENCLAVCLGANNALTAADVRAFAPRLHRSDLVAATFESPDAPIEAAFALARAREIKTLLNPSPYRPIAPSILAQTSILVVNAVEANALGLGAASQSDGALQATPAIERLLGGGLELLIVTLGSRGAVAFRKQARPFHQSAFEVAAVDTVGAGDAFSAGLIAGLLADKPLEDALQGAAACGALTTLHFGAFGSFPSARTLAAFVERNAPKT
ncbi:ribokinase [Methylobacterium mesophilicum SR1.6/6]|uniref:Ribokinase n=1 Tax=Methylobacterium mesophilicum SR1.6/6 TaxID=908290 RepID=A0A6B9FMR7_9HYPH|nr:PfkB family carbohydrate kinase [Methylobacterium mesophilicum]QGY02474.1 ribokinase [Methylobacterium mesophilicum SR1.6/6]